MKDRHGLPACRQTRQGRRAVDVVEADGKALACRERERRCSRAKRQRPPFLAAFVGQPAAQFLRQGLLRDPKVVSNAVEVVHGKILAGLIFRVNSRTA